MFLLVCFPHYALNELVSSPMNNDVVNSVSFIKMTRKKKFFFFFQLLFYINYNVYMCQLDSYGDVSFDK